MARRKISKKTQRKVKRAAKKYPAFTAIVVLLVIVIVGCCLLHYKGYITVPFLEGVIPQEKETEIDSKGGSFTEQDITTIKDSDLSIHFLELGNKYTGDSTLIKVGDTEVLIDAGSREDSAETIATYVQQFCTDGILEYVIATHADQDHIAGFVGSGKEGGIFDRFECETIIDFPRTNKTTDIYQRYVEEREAEVTAGAVHYTALECYNEEKGASRSYTLGNGITMNFLYQKFYEEKSSDEESIDENNYSVCMLLSQGEKHYLFTGDLEEEGEADLAARYELPKCVLFKAGHHGSKTSSTEALLSEIKPDIVCVCCCCGSDEYNAKPENTFPTQAFVNRVSQYTDKVYVTTLATTSSTGFTSMNGDIVIMSNDGEIFVRCSNNATLLKDTDWFKNNRDCPDGWK